MKKLILNAFCFVSVFCLSMVVFSVGLNAYIDPSAMFYVFQGIAAVVIAIGAVIGIYWRKAKKKVSKTLNIDENQNKEIETDEIIDKSEDA